MFDIYSLEQQLYVVVRDSGGAHEADSVYSVWVSKTSAENEARRLDLVHKYGGRFHVVDIQVNKRYDDNIESTGADGGKGLPS